MQAFISLLKPRNTMNKIFSYGIIALGIGILFSSLNNSALSQEVGNSLSEDQAVICIKDVWTEDFKKQGNEKVACTIIQDLDLLNDAQERYIYSKFMAELDTFNLSDLTGMID